VSSTEPPPPPGAPSAPALASDAPAPPASAADDLAPADRDTLTSDEQALADHTAAVPEGSDADLWAFAFDSSLRAQEALLASMRLLARGQLTLEDAAIVTKVRGKVRITQTKDVTPSQGAVGGAWIGTLAGLFVGVPLLGAALGAAAGGLFAKLRDIGIDDARMKAMGDELADGEAALFLLVADCHRAHALYEVARFPGRLLASTADEELVEVVRDRLAVDPWAVT
jgi:uncharacterized membrane protein